MDALWSLLLVNFDTALSWVKTHKKSPNRGTKAPNMWFMATGACTGTWHLTFLTWTYVPTCASILWCERTMWTSDVLSLPLENKPMWLKNSKTMSTNVCWVHLKLYCSRFLCSSSWIGQFQVHPLCQAVFKWICVCVVNVPLYCVPSGYMTHESCCLGQIFASSLPVLYLLLTVGCVM